MALNAQERQAAFAVGRRYMNQHDAGMHVTDPMLNGLIDAMIAALEPIWAERTVSAKPAKTKSGDD